MNPDTIEKIRSMTPRDLMMAGLHKISDDEMNVLYDLDEADGDPEFGLVEKIDFAQGLEEDKQNNELVELPGQPIEIHFFPNKEKAFGENSEATFFVEALFDEDATKKSELDYTQAQIVIAVIPKMSCPYGQCGLSEVTQAVAKKFKGNKIDFLGIGCTYKDQNQQPTFEWGSVGPRGSSQEANSEDMDYHGPKPSKLANWVMDQLKTQVDELF